MHASRRGQMIPAALPPPQVLARPHAPHPTCARARLVLPSLPRTPTISPIRRSCRANGGRTSPAYAASPRQPLHLIATACLSRPGNVTCSDSRRISPLKKVTLQFVHLFKPLQHHCLLPQTLVLDHGVDENGSLIQLHRAARFMCLCLCAPSTGNNKVQQKVQAATASPRMANYWQLAGCSVSRWNVGRRNGSQIW